MLLKQTEETALRAVYDSAHHPTHSSTESKHMMIRLRCSRTSRSEDESSAAFQEGGERTDGNVHSEEENENRKM